MMQALQHVASQITYVSDISTSHSGFPDAAGDKFELPGMGVTPSSIDSGEGSKCSLVSF